MNPRSDTEHLSAWLDGELDEAEAAELEAELARDPELRAELASLESVVHLFRSEAPAPAPLGFDRRVMARIDEEFPESPSWWSRLRRPGGIPLEGWVLGLAAAAALLLVLPIRNPGADEAAPALKELSPAAVELPRPQDPVVPSTPVAGPGEKGSESKWIGRATTGEDSIPKEAPLVAISGTEARPEEAQVDPAAGVGGTAEATEPTATDPVDPGEYRYVVRSKDAGMKREILAIASRYGTGATSTDAKPITDGRMRSGTEELVVALAHTDLAAFDRDLAAFARDLAAEGYTVEAHVPENELLGGTVEVRIALQLVGGGAPNAAPMVPNAARTQQERAADAIGEAF